MDPTNPNNYTYNTQPSQQNVPQNQQQYYQPMYNVIPYNSNFHMLDPNFRPPVTQFGIPNFRLPFTTVPNPRFPTPVRPNLTYIPPTSHNPNFTNIEDDTFPPFSSQTPRSMNDVDEQNENTEDQLTPTSERSKAAWSTQEDEALISSFMEISEDPTVGTNQGRGTFWRRVKELYDVAQTSNPESLGRRNQASLDGRMRRISTIVMKWSGCMDQANRRRRSGISEEDVIQEARELYKPMKFTLEHAWNMMKHYPKWKIAVAPYVLESSQKNSRGVTSSNDLGAGDHESGDSGKRVRLDDGDHYATPISVDGESTSTQRPQGIKAAKKGKKKVSAVNDEIDMRFQIMQETAEREMLLEKEKLERRKQRDLIEKEKLELNKLKEARRQRDTDWSMLQELLRQPQLPPQLEELKMELLEKFRRP